MADAGSLPPVPRDVGIVSTVDKSDADEHTRYDPMDLSYSIVHGQPRPDKTVTNQLAKLVAETIQLMSANSMHTLSVRVDRTFPFAVDGLVGMRWKALFHGDMITAKEAGL